MNAKRSGFVEGVILHHLLTLGFFTGWAIFRRLVTGRGHGITPTIVEEFLRASYLSELGASNRERTRELFKGLFRAGPGAPLLTGLTGAGKTVIGLVGQGLGVEGLGAYSRYAHAKRQDRSPVRAVAIAPTLSFDRTWDILETLGGASEVLLLGLTDENERADHLHAALYPSSVLYLASGVYEKDADYPFVGMERFHKHPKLSTSHECRQFRTQFGPALHWSPSGTVPPNGIAARCNADWSSEPHTQTAVLHFLRGEGGRG